MAKEWKKKQFKQVQQVAYNLGIYKKPEDYLKAQMHKDQEQHNSVI